MFRFLNIGIGIDAPDNWHEFARLSLGMGTPFVDRLAYEVDCHGFSRIFGGVKVAFVICDVKDYHASQMRLSPNVPEPFM